jgi:hypothetical protein
VSRHLRQSLHALQLWRKRMAARRRMSVGKRRLFPVAKKRSVSTSANERIIPMHINNMFMAVKTRGPISSRRWREPHREFAAVEEAVSSPGSFFTCGTDRLRIRCPKATEGHFRLCKMKFDAQWTLATGPLAGYLPNRWAITSFRRCVGPPFLAIRRHFGQGGTDRTVAMRASGNAFSPVFFQSGLIPP